MVNSKKMWIEALDEIHQVNKNDKINLIIRDDKGVIELKTSQYSLNIKITDSWVGYEFILDKRMLGVTMTSWEDTDNYALDFNIDVTQEIFDDTICFIRNLLSNKIYIGTKEKRAILAVPESNGSYLLSYSPRFYFFTKREWKTSSEVIKDKQMRPLIADAS